MTSIKGDIDFKIRFNTQHGDTELYWRIIIGNTEYLANSLHCLVPTYSDASFDERAGAIKYHMAGSCIEFCLNEVHKAIFK